MSHGSGRFVAVRPRSRRGIPREGRRRRARSPAKFALTCLERSTARRRVVATHFERSTARRRVVATHFERSTARRRVAATHFERSTARRASR